MKDSDAAWEEFRHSLVSILASTEPKWDQIQYAFMEGYSRGYHSAHKSCADDAYKQGVEDTQKDVERAYETLLTLQNSGERLTLLPDMTKAILDAWAEEKADDAR